MLKISEFICLVFVVNIVTCIFLSKKNKEQLSNTNVRKKIFTHVNAFLLLNAAICAVHHVFFEMGELILSGLPYNQWEEVKDRWRPTPGIYGLPLFLVLLILLKILYGKKKIKGLHFFIVTPLILAICTTIISLYGQSYIVDEVVCVYYGHGHLICLTDILVNVGYIVSWLLSLSHGYIYGGTLLMLPAVISIYVGIYMFICLPCFEGEALEIRIEKCRKANRLAMVAFLCFFVETIFWRYEIYWHFAYVIFSNLWTEFCLWRIRKVCC